MQNNQMIPYNENNRIARAEIKDDNVRVCDGDVDATALFDDFYKMAVNAPRLMSKPISEDPYEQIAVQRSTNIIFRNRAMHLINMSLMVFNANILYNVNAYLEHTSKNYAQDQMASNIVAVDIRDLQNDPVQMIIEPDSYIAGVITEKTRSNIAFALTSSLLNAFYSKNMPMYQKLLILHLLDFSSMLLQILKS